MNTLNQSKWKATMEYLKKCPEGPDKTVKTSQHIDLEDKTGLPTTGQDRSTSPPPGRWRSRSPRAVLTPNEGKPRVGHSRGRSPESRGGARSDDPALPMRDESLDVRNVGFDRDRSPVLAGAARLPIKPSGLKSLQEMAQSTPPHSNSNADEWASFVETRVKVDTADLDAFNFEIEPRNKLPRKLAPSAALASFPKTENLDAVHQSVVSIYTRKLSKILDAIPDRKSRAWKSISKLCDSLNIQTPSTGPLNCKDLAVLLARLRAVDMTRKPI